MKYFGRMHHVKSSKARSPNFAFSPNMRISSSCLDYLTLKTSEATKLYLTVFDERNTVYFLESFDGLFWKFLAVSRRSTD